MTTRCSPQDVLPWIHTGTGYRKLEGAPRCPAPARNGSPIASSEHPLRGACRPGVRGRRDDNHRLETTPCTRCCRADDTDWPSVSVTCSAEPKPVPEIVMDDPGGASARLAETAAFVAPR